jgi:hypothetical protein
MNDEERYEEKRLQWWKVWCKENGHSEDLASSFMNLSDGIDDDIFDGLKQLNI